MLKYVSLVLSFLVCISALAIAQQSQPERPEMPEVAKDRGPAKTAPPRNRSTQANDPQFQLQTRNPRYEIRSGDVLELVFPFTPEFNQSVMIQPDGYITLREAGDVFVQGQTVAQARAAIFKAYSPILRDPNVSVVLKNFEAPHFIVTGQVTRPGKYDLRGDTTVTEAVAIAGGLNEKAKHSQVLLFRRVSKDWYSVKMLDLKSLYQGKDLSEDVHLQPGDMVVVPQNSYSKIKPFLPTLSVGTYVDPTR